MKTTLGIIGTILAIGLFIYPAWAGGVKWFDADGNPVDGEQYETLSVDQQEKVDRLKQDLRSEAMSLTDEKGRPLFNEDGLPMEYPDTPSAYSMPSEHGSSTRSKSKWIVRGREYSSSMDAAKASGSKSAPKTFGVKGMTHQQAMGIDKAIFDQAFRRAASTGDFSGLDKWRQGTKRRQAGMFTSEEYDTTK